MTSIIDFNDVSKYLDTCVSRIGLLTLQHDIEHALRQDVKVLRYQLSAYLLVHSVFLFISFLVVSPYIFRDNHTLNVLKALCCILARLKHLALLNQDLLGLLKVRRIWYLVWLLHINHLLRFVIFNSNYLWLLKHLVLLLYLV